MEGLNNREIAILVWLSLVIGLVATKRNARTAMIDLVQLAFAKTFIKIYATIFLYVLAVVYGLYQIGLWNTAQLKITCIWLFSAALISAFRANKIKDDPDYFKKAVKDNVNLLIFLEFVLTFYTFPLVWEFALVPVGAFLGAMKAYSDGKPEYRSVTRLLDGVFVLLAICTLGYVAYNISVSFKEFATTLTLREFYTTPLLSLLFLPYLFALSVFMAYERVFIKLQRNSDDDAIYQFAKKASIRNFKYRVRQLERWSNTTFHKRLTSEEFVIKSIDAFKALLDYETNPKPVAPDQGWAPYQAKDFLSEHGLKTGYYENYFDEQWFASSNSLKVGDGILPNTVTYYVSGDQFAAKSLKLKLYISEPENSVSAISRYVELAEILLGKALSAEVATNLDILIRESGDAETTVAGKLVSVKREEWNSGKINQYDICLTISVPPNKKLLARRI